MIKNFWQEWDFNPCKHSCTRNLEREIFFNLAPQTARPSCLVKCTVHYRLGCLPLFCHFERFKYVICFHISFPIFGISFFEVINWSSTTNFVNAKKCNSRDASIWFFCSYRGRFWTQAHSGVTKVSIENSQVGSLYRLTFKTKTASSFILFLFHEILRNA